MKTILPNLSAKRKFFTPRGWISRPRTAAEITHWKTHGKPHPNTEANDNAAIPGR